MKVLLHDGATKATAQTMIVIALEVEAVLCTLAGRPVRLGIVAEADGTDVQTAVAAALPGERTWDEVTWMARALGSWEVGSRIGLNIFPRGWALDTSEAIRVERAMGLRKGDTVIIGPPADEEIMNARGRVISMTGDLVGVELASGDRDRLERSRVRKVPAVVYPPRHCVEKASSAAASEHARSSEAGARCSGPGHRTHEHDLRRGDR